MWDDLGGWIVGRFCGLATMLGPGFRGHIFLHRNRHSKASRFFVRKKERCSVTQCSWNDTGGGGRGAGQCERPTLAWALLEAGQGPLDPPLLLRR